MKVKHRRSRRTAILICSAVALLLSSLSLTTSEADAQSQPTCFGQPATIVSNASVIQGTEGDDVIVGGPASQTIHGNGGDDLICGKEGDDKIFGNQGADRIKGGHGDDTLNGGQHDDELYGDHGNDKLYGKTGNDVIAGASGNDYISGASGDDVLRGGGGVDTINGYAGNDTIKGGTSGDVLSGGDGHDAIYGEKGNDTLRGNKGDDVLSGGEGNDKVDGDDGNDKLYGYGGDDVINGGPGDDGIQGGSGHDVVHGGDGNDTMWGQEGNDKLYGEAGNDTARGDEGTDDCDAETESTCEVVDSAPTWVSGAQVVLESISQVDIGVSWGAYSGNADIIELTLINAGGERSNPVPLEARVHSSWLVNEFNGNALHPDEVYTLSIVAENESGRSDAIELYPISVLGFESHSAGDLEPAPQTAASRAESQTWVRVRTFTGHGDCPIEPLEFTSMRTWTFLWFESGRHEATTKWCTDGANVISNRTELHTCTKDAQSDTDSVVSAPDSPTPNTNIVRNLFVCNWDGQLTAALRGDISAALTKGKVKDALNVDFGGELNFDGAHQIQHTLEVNGNETRVRVEHWHN